MSIEIVNKIDPIESVDAKFRLLMVREYSRALRKITHKVRSASIAEDIIQKTLLRLWQKYPNKSSNELGPLFNTILQNITMDHFREKLRDLHVYGTEEDSPVYDIPASDGDASVQLENIQLRNALLAGMSTLSDRQREVWNMRHVREMSIEGIAIELDLSKGSVKTHLSRAQQKLAQLFNGYGETGHFSEQLQKILLASVNSIIQPTDKPLLGELPNINTTNRLHIDQILLLAIEGGSINLENWEAYHLSANGYNASSGKGAIIPTTKSGVAKVLGVSQNGLYPANIVQCICKKS